MIDIEGKPPKIGSQMRTVPGPGVSMKHRLQIIKSLIGCALALAAVLAGAQTPLTGAAKVIRLKGAARASAGNFVWRPIKVGDVLQAGAVIQTSADPGTYVDLVLGDGKTAVPQPMVYRPSIANSFSASTTTFQPASEQNTVRLWGDGALAIEKLTTLQTGA